MALAKHIEIAREDGPKAGFNAWIDMMERSGLPQVQERLAEVREQGNKKAQFEYYCNVYGDKIFGRQSRSSNVVHEDTNLGDLAENAGSDVQELFAQFLALVGKGQPQADDEDTSLDDVDEDDYIPSGATTTQRTTRSSGKRTSTKRATTRSNAQGDDQFAPRNPQDDATSGRLWRLNELGLLRVADRPGKHISNGQAHEILKARLG